MEIDNQARIPLGVVSLLGQSFAVFFRRLPLFVLIAFVPSVIVGVVSNTLMSGVISQAGAGDPFAMFGPAYFVVLALSMLQIIFISALLTLAAYDVASGNPVRIGHYIGQTLRFFLPLFVLGLLYWIITSIGFVALFVPGLYLAARYWVMVPAMLVEPAGWGAMGRASALSRSYRWPMVGGLILLLIVIVLISLGAQMVTGLILMGSALSFMNPEAGLQMMGFGGWRFALLMVLQAVSAAVIYGLGAIYGALLYARLREIKEGIGVEDLAKVFA